MVQQNDIQVLVERSAQGDEGALALLTVTLYGELRGLAKYYLAGQQGHTLQPTALVNEACLKLLKGDTSDWNGRPHLKAVAALAMKGILISLAQKKRTEKHGGSVLLVTLDELKQAPEEGKDMLELALALEELGKVDPRAARVVDFKYFGGLTNDEIAAELGISSATVKNDWAFAKTWLFERLSAPR